ncbi:MAG: PD40 domain-containing protein [Chloroflexi bacterium]|nr:PD40 domain-containing protein [Chloroflexota bacterium]
MRIRLTWVAVLIVAALMLAACDAGSNATTAPGGATTAATAGNETPGGPRAGGTRGPGGPGGGTPGAGRPGGNPNATPGAGRPGGNGTTVPQTAATPSGTAIFAPTAVRVGGQPASNNVAPTQVPRPTVLMPTVAPFSTATPTPVTPLVIPYTPVPMGPVPTIAPIGTPMSLPSLRGKILFMTDREAYPTLYMMNADGSGQQPCNCSDALETLVDREMTSPDAKQYLFYRVLGGRGGDQQIWAHRIETGYETMVTGAAPGFPGIDYDAVWSPDSRHIAFVTQINGYDEIYLYDAVENTNERLTQSSKEWYKHPSFSPDGSQIVYWTNVEAAERKQIWVMNLDGSGKHNISQNGYNDYSPIWVK